MSLAKIFSIITIVFLVLSFVLPDYVKVIAGVWLFLLFIVIPILLLLFGNNKEDVNQDNHETKEVKG